MCYSGKLLLCIRPAGGADALHSVKWHSRQQDVLAVASQANIYLLNVLDAAAMYRGDPIVQSDLLRLVQPFSMSSVFTSSTTWELILTSNLATGCDGIRPCALCYCDDFGRFDIDSLEHPRQSAFLVSKDPRRRHALLHYIR